MNSVAGDMPGSERVVELQISANLPCQLIFRMRRTKLFDTTVPEGFEFVLVGSVFRFVRLSGAFWRIAGPRELLRGIARVCVRRKFYCVHKNGHILHYGWVNVAFCKHYPVKSGEVVIGPIWSALEARGHGLATVGIQMVINELIKRSLTIFFIDTSFENLACLKVIEKCGFGAPVGCLPR